MISVIGVLFIGAAGLVAGAACGWSLGRRTVGAAHARTVGALCGIVVGVVMAAELIREVSASSSSTAAIGMIFVPVPVVANGVAGALSAGLVYRWRVRGQEHPPP